MHLNLNMFRAAMLMVSVSLLVLRGGGKPGQYFRVMPQPGEFFSGRPSITYCRDLSGPAEDVKQKILIAVKNDAKALGLIFEEISGNDHKPKPGNWLVALAYYYDSQDECDYHWWRKNDDGGWSHKLGSSPISCLDFADKKITNPQFCKRGKYNTFLGYYEVGPAN